MEIIEIFGLKLVLTLRGVLSGRDYPKKEFFEQLNFAWLYASEDVLKNCYEFQKELFGKKRLDENKMLKLTERTLKSMRNDLGLKSGELNNLFNNVIMVSKSHTLKSEKHV